MIINIFHLLLVQLISAQSTTILSYPITNCASAVFDNDYIYLGSKPVTAMGAPTTMLRFLKISSNGLKLFDYEYGDTLYDSGISHMVKSATGDIYVMGSTLAALDGQPRLGPTNDVFLTKFNSLGGKLWTKLYGSSGTEYAYKMSYSPALDSVFTAQWCGTAVSGSTFAGGGSDWCYARFSSTGTMSWIKETGTNAMDLSYATHLGRDNTEMLVSGSMTSAGFGAIARINVLTGAVVKMNSYSVDLIQTINDAVYVPEIAALYLTATAPSGVYIYCYNYDTMAPIWARLLNIGKKIDNSRVRLSPGVGLYIYGATPATLASGIAASAGVLVLAGFQGSLIANLGVFGESKENSLLAGEIIGSKMRFALQGIQAVQIIDINLPFAQSSSSSASEYAVTSTTSFSEAFWSFISGTNSSTAHASSSPDLKSTDPFSSISSDPATLEVITFESTSSVLTTDVESYSTVADSTSTKGPVISMGSFSSDEDYEIIIPAISAVSSQSAADNGKQELNGEANTFPFFKYVLIALLSGMAVVMITLVLVAHALLKPKRKSKHQSKKKTRILREDTHYDADTSRSNIIGLTNLYENPTTMSAAGNTTAFSTVDYTITGTSMGLELPGFLQFVYGQDFKQLNRLASGGAGDIHLAQAITPQLIECGTTIIMKTFKAESDTFAKKILEQEIAIMNLLRGKPYIAKFLGYSDSPVAILMKFYPKGSLANFVSNKDDTVSKAMLLKFVFQIASGLESMHNVGLVHSDIKTANILLDWDDRGDLFCVITDFGITRIVNTKLVRIRQMRINNVQGLSVQYAAPEQLNENNPRTVADSHLPLELVPFRDIYSLSMVFIALANRMEPWRFRMGSRKGATVYRQGK